MELKELRNNWATFKDVQVLEKLSSGLTHKEIAGKLNLSVRTIDTKVKVMKERTGAKNVVELVVIAMKEKVIQP